MGSDDAATKLRSKTIAVHRLCEKTNNSKIVGMHGKGRKLELAFKGVAKTKPGTTVPTGMRLYKKIELFC